ncbi:hypothetical protein ABB37_09769 [Leptomonas pyrrhocoris]|uniref:Transmembrane protein n=1 Tax=Leptomonas pyrrhocoris TaxID=157538 RepID=A0A0M9FPZ6_LEPPY|nr:hypothetical protein ABB37_09769 [Leptomonas pyrrhocoris]KPA73637.1 hypothetical protein ABB37_09769 [Leptomonas pyrrhocoris]|eukprot:XP_015652076.1 hypothetical protein ABB37_09769 [Leptomonas pyrrhocoris]
MDSGMPRTTAQEGEGACPTGDAPSLRCSSSATCPQHHLSATRRQGGDDTHSPLMASSTSYTADRQPKKRGGVRFSGARLAVLLNWLFFYVVLLFVSAVLPRWCCLAPRLPLLFAHATPFGAALSFSTTAFTPSTCPSSFDDINSATRENFVNTCPFYDLYFILIFEAPVGAETRSHVGRVREKEEEAVVLSARKETLFASANVTARWNDLNAQRAMPSASVNAAAAAEEEEEEAHFSSVFKGPRNGLSAYYEVLTTEEFFYMLTGCTIVVEVGSGVAPAYAYNSFQAYVEGFRLDPPTAPIVAAALGTTTTSTTTTTTTTVAPTKSSSRADDTRDSHTDAVRMVDDGTQTSDAFFATATSTTAAPLHKTTASGEDEVYPNISSKTTFFYWNQPRLHCLLNAPVLMAMRTPQQTSSLSRMGAGGMTAATPTAAAATAAQRRRQSPQPDGRVNTARSAGTPTDTTGGSAQTMKSVWERQAGERLVGARRHTAVELQDAPPQGPVSSAYSDSSFASCARYLPPPAKLLPPVPISTLLTANYLQLSSSLVLKVISYDVWYQLSHPPSSAADAWVSAASLLEAYADGAARKRSYSTAFQRLRRTRHDSATTTTAATEDGDVTMEDVVNAREDAYESLGYNLAIDPARVCAAPALYTVSLNALLAQASSWSLGTSGDWLQTNVTLRHRYPAARAVVVVAQCSGVPLSFTVRITFTNPHDRIGSGQNYYISIIYFLFLVCYAILAGTFLFLIVPCGKRRRRWRERELKEKDAAKVQGAHAAGVKSDHARRHRRHRFRRHRAASPDTAEKGGAGGEANGGVSGSSGGKTAHKSPRQHKGTSSTPSAKHHDDSDEPINSKEEENNDGNSGGQRTRSEKGSPTTKKVKATAQDSGGAEAEMSSLHSLYSNASAPSSDDVAINNSSSSEDGDDEDSTSTSTRSSSSSSSSSSNDYSSLYSDLDGFRRPRATPLTSSDDADSASAGDASGGAHGAPHHHRHSRCGRHRRQRQRRSPSPSNSSSSSAASLARTRRSKPADLFTLLCCWAVVANPAANSHDDGSSHHHPHHHRHHRRSELRRRRPVHQRCLHAIAALGYAVYAGLTCTVIAPMERWWRESYILIMYAPLQWLLLVLMALKVLLCILYSAKYSLMAGFSIGGVTSNYSLFVVSVIFAITVDTLVIPVEMLIGMGWGLAFTYPLPTNQIVIVCLATIGMFTVYIFQATCDTDGYNLALTANKYAKAANTARCNSVTYARIALELVCRLHNVLRMLLLMLWLSRSVIPADAAAVQRQRRLQERQLRRHRRQQLHDGHRRDTSGDNGGAYKGRGGGGGGGAPRASSLSSAVEASAAARRGNGLTSDPPPQPPPPIALAPPPRLDYPSVVLPAMDVYLRYRRMWVPFGMLLVWYVLHIAFAFSFFQPEDYYMVVAFREFQTFYLFAFLVFFLRTSSPEYS